MENTATIGSIVGPIISAGVTLYTIAIVVLAIAICKRTSSSHILLARLWSFFTGNKECLVEPAATFFNERAAIHQFRFTTGVRVTKLTQIEQLVRLDKRDDTVLPLIAAAGNRVDLDHLRLKSPMDLPKQWTLFIVALITAALIGALVASVGATIVDRAILRMKSSGTWFTLDANYAKPLSDAQGFALSSCSLARLPTKEITGFSLEDTSAICKAFSATDTKGYIEATVASQRWALTVLSALIFYAALTTYGWVRQGSSARILQKRFSSLFQHSPSPGVGTDSLTTTEQIIPPQQPDRAP